MDTCTSDCICKGTSISTCKFTCTYVCIDVHTHIQTHQRLHCHMYIDVENDCICMCSCIDLSYLNVHNHVYVCVYVCFVSCVFVLAMGGVSGDYDFQGHGELQVGPWRKNLEQGGFACESPKMKHAEAVDLLSLSMNAQSETAHMLAVFTRVKCTQVGVCLFIFMDTCLNHVYSL